MKLKAIIVEDIDSEAGRVPGAVELRLAHRGKGVAGFGFRCPCGCGHEGYLPIRMHSTSRTETPEWEWDGDEASPTLSPSVFNSGFPCRWHGWLRNGEWETA